ARISEELPDDHLRSLVVAFAETVMPDLTLRVDEVEGGPVVVGEGTPDGEVVVDRDRIVDLSRLYRPAHVVEIVLELELWRVDADYDQPMIQVPLSPSSEVRLRAEPVDAGVGPELHDHDVPSEGSRRQRRRVEPRGGAVERADRALERKVAGRNAKDPRHPATISLCRHASPSPSSVVVGIDDRVRKRFAPGARVSVGNADATRQDHVPQAPFHSIDSMPSHTAYCICERRFLTP